jgi:hypothetical protein
MWALGVVIASAQAKPIKNFLLLFFKKEVLLFLHTRYCSTS